MSRGGRGKRGNLVMHRFPGQSVYIGRSITLTILGITDEGEIKVSIEAPKWMAISRDQFTREEHMEHQKRREEEEGLPPCQRCGRNHDPKRSCHILRDDENHREDYMHGGRSGSGY